MTGRDIEAVTTRAARVERFFARAGLALTTLLLALLLVNTVSFLLFKLYDAANRERESKKRAALIEQLGRPRGGGGGAQQSAWWDMMSASPAYDPFPWAEEFWREERAHFAQSPKARYVPYRLWANHGPRRGRFVNTDESGFRIAPDALGADAPHGAFTIFFLGGSAAYGTGSPDSETITSHLSRVVAERLAKPEASASPGAAPARRPVRVVNLGVHAYNSNQELLLLIELLKRGERPDLVIFYDGANDSATGPALHWDYHNVKSKLEAADAPDAPGLTFLRGTSLYRLASALKKRLPGAAPDALPAVAAAAPDAAARDEAVRAHASATLDNWLDNRKLVSALADEYSFSYLFVWQPVFFYGAKPLCGAERVMAEHPELVYVVTFDARAGRAMERVVRATYAEAERRAAREDFLFLAGAFDNVADPVYIDWVHTGPLGNRVVASRIADHLESRQYPPFAARK